MRRQPSPETLRAASDHVFYEYWMFCAVAQAMASGVFGKSALSNAVLESFVMHSRVLLDFLYSERPREDDLIADDYFNSASQWADIRPEKTDLLRTIHRRVGKELAHLTYARIGISTKDKQWPFIQIAEDIHIVIDVFRGHVDKDLLGPKWASLPFEPLTYQGSD